MSWNLQIWIQDLLCRKICSCRKGSWLKSQLRTLRRFLSGAFVKKVLQKLKFWAIPNLKKVILVKLREICEEQSHCFKSAYRKPKTFCEVKFTPAKEGFALQFPLVTKMVQTVFSDWSWTCILSEGKSSFCRGGTRIWKFGLTTFSKEKVALVRAIILFVDKKLFPILWREKLLPGIWIL